MKKITALSAWSTGLTLALTMSFLLCAVEDNDFSSMQMKGVHPVTVKVDIDAAAKRLSRAVKFPTISNQYRNDFDAKVFEDYHQFLKDTRRWKKLYVGHGVII
jgi:carboxypeptidase PM20D1